MPYSALRGSRRTVRATGSALIFAVAIVLALAVVGVLLVRMAGNDRIEAGMMGIKDRGLTCAEAGLQYGRSFYGSTYETSNGWNNYLAQGSGYRYDPANGDARPDLATVPKQTLGYSNGTTLDPGANIGGTGQASFWVTIRDDDDERPVGLPDNPSRDNNEVVIIRSECINPSFAETAGGVPKNVVLEAVLAHVQGSSGYGIATRGSNTSDLVGGR